jgi:hypothetical protein
MANLAGQAEQRPVLTEHRQYLAEWCRETKDPFAAPG